MPMKCAICDEPADDAQKECSQCGRSVCAHTCWRVGPELCIDCYYVQNPLETPVIKEFEMFRRE